MNSRHFEDNNGVLWIVTLKIGVGKARYRKDVDNYDPTKPYLLEFKSVDRGVKKKFCINVGNEKDSVEKFTIEELKEYLVAASCSKIG